MSNPDFFRRVRDNPSSEAVWQDYALWLAYCDTTQEKIVRLLIEAGSMANIHQNPEWLGKLTELRRKTDGLWFERIASLLDVAAGNPPHPADVEELWDELEVRPKSNSSFVLQKQFARLKKSLRRHIHRRSVFEQFTVSCHPMFQWFAAQKRLMDIEFPARLLLLEFVAQKVFPVIDSQPKREPVSIFDPEFLPTRADICNALTRQWREAAEHLEAFYKCLLQEHGDDAVGFRVSDAWSGRTCVIYGESWIICGTNSTISVFRSYEVD